MKKIIVGFSEIAIERLVKANWNYKENDPLILDKLKENIKRNGIIENLIVRELPTGFYEVVNGNHRLDALVDLQWASAIMVFNLGVVSLSQAQRVAIETNETRFERNDSALGKVISGILEEFEKADLVLTMPFEEKELDRLLSVSSVNWEKFDNKTIEEDIEPIAEHFKIELDFASQEELDEFLAILGTPEKEKLAEVCLKLLRKVKKK